MKTIIKAIINFFRIIFCRKQKVIQMPHKEYEPYTPTMFDIEIGKLINQSRRDADTANNRDIRAELTFHKELCAVSNSHSVWMVKTGVASHAFFMDRAAEFPDNYVAEIVGYYYRLPIGFVNAWIRSDGHRMRMLDDYEHFGIATQKDAAGRIYATVLFLRNKP